MRKRQIIKVEFVVGRMDNDFMKIGNRVFVLDNPNLPAFFVRGSATDAVEFFTGNLLKTGTKNTYFVDIYRLCLGRPFRPAFGYYNPTVGRNVRNVFCHSLSLADLVLLKKVKFDKIVPGGSEHFT